MKTKNASYSINRDVLKKLGIMAAMMALGVLFVFMPIYFLWQTNSPEIVKIKGVVVDNATSEPLAGVEVRWMGKSLDFKVKTDVDGFFMIEGENKNDAFDKVSFFLEDYSPIIKEFSFKQAEAANSVQEINMGTLNLKKEYALGGDAEKLIKDFEEVLEGLLAYKHDLQEEVSIIVQKEGNLSREEALKKVELEGDIRELGLQMEHIRDASLLFQLRQVDQAFAMESLVGGKEILAKRADR